MANAPAQVGPGQGARTDIQHSDDVRKLSNTGGNSSDYLASRIKRDRPDIAEAVERDQLKWSKSMAGRMLAIARNDRLAEVDPGLLPPSWSILFALTSKAIAGDAAPSWLWPALVAHLVQHGGTVEAIRKQVGLLKDVVTPPAWVREFTFLRTSVQQNGTPRHA
jgi:hypothetical protein